MDKNVFFSVVVPLLGVGGTAVLAISTPDDEFNYYTELLELKVGDNDEPLFNVIKVGLACDACVELGKSSECPHLVHELPHWKTYDRQVKMRKIMESDPELYTRENMGVVVSKKQFLFDPRLIKAFFAIPPFISTHGITDAHVAIDPSGGGSQSDYAICSAFNAHGRKVVTPSFFFSSFFLRNFITAPRGCGRCSPSPTQGSLTGSSAP